MSSHNNLPALRLSPATSAHALAAPEFRQLAQVRPATEWFAGIDNLNTRRAYRNDLKKFMAFIGRGLAGPAPPDSTIASSSWRSSATEMGHSLAGLKVGAAQTYSNLTLFPLIGDEDSAPGYVLLDEALRRLPCRGCVNSRDRGWPWMAHRSGDAVEAMRVRAIADDARTRSVVPSKLQGHYRAFP